MLFRNAWRCRILSPAKYWCLYGRYLCTFISLYMCLALLNLNVQIAGKISSEFV